MKPPSLKAIAALNGVALVAVAASFLIPQFQKIQRWNTAEKIKAEQDIAADMERANFERQKAIADAAAANQIAQFDQLVIQDYTATPGNPPALDWQNSVDPNHRTLIFDQYRVCVGNAYQGQFTFIFDDQTACNREILSK